MVFTLTGYIEVKTAVLCFQIIVSVLKPFFSPAVKKGSCLPPMICDLPSLCGLSSSCVPFLVCSFAPVCPDSNGYFHEGAREQEEWKWKWLALIVAVWKCVRSSAGLQISTGSVGSRLDWAMSLFYALSMKMCLDDPVSAGVKLSVCISKPSVSSNTLIRSRESTQSFG